MSGRRKSCQIAADALPHRAGQRRLHSGVGSAPAKELSDLEKIIMRRLSTGSPGEVFDPLWSLLHPAPTKHERTDDSIGAISDLSAQAKEAIAALAPRIKNGPTAFMDWLRAPNYPLPAGFPGPVSDFFRRVSLLSYTKDIRQQ